MSVRRADGSRVWVTVNTQPLFRPGATRPYSVVASFADITHQKQAELALQESEERYRTLFENTIDAVLLTAPDGSIFAANPEACRLLDRTEEEICRAGRSGIVDLSDPRVAEALKERAQTGKFRKELTLICGDGSRFEAEVSSAVFTDRDGNLRTSMVFRDITERKQAYHLLEERVAERTGEIAALLEVSRNVASMLELAPLLTAILTQLKSRSGLHRGWDSDPGRWALENGGISGARGARRNVGAHHPLGPGLRLSASRSAARPSHHRRCLGRHALGRHSSGRLGQSRVRRHRGNACLAGRAADRQGKADWRAPDRPQPAGALHRTGCPTGHGVRATGGRRDRNRPAV